jgi:FkbM family methyltransferase
MIAADAILIDIETGRVSDARLHERLALALIRLAVVVMAPIHLYGFSYVCRAVRTLLPSRRKMVFVLAPDARMLTDYCDAYWSVLLQPGFPYEPENLALMTHCRAIPYGFIDGGANHGLWSIRISGDAGGRKPVVAVEAASDTFARLELNNALNANRFVTLNRAIGAVSGVPVKIYGAKHESRSTVAPDPAAKPILDTVTVSLDALAAHAAFNGISKFVVKLDVEGVEIDAMSAAEQLRAKDSLFVYEDHGSDRTHETTRHVMEKLGMRVFWLGRDGGAREITDVRQMNAIKKSRRFGYDFAASSSNFWIDHLNTITGNRAGAAQPLAA